MFRRWNNKAGTRKEELRIPEGELNGCGCCEGLESAVTVESMERCRQARKAKNNAILNHMSK